MLRMWENIFTMERGLPVVLGGTEWCGWETVRSVFL